MAAGEGSSPRADWAGILAAAVKARRVKLGITQGMLHEETGIGLSLISRIERGMANPTLETLEVLASGLNCEVPELFVHGADS